MSENDDPWANHVRGTPMAEGTDPLSLPSASIERKSTTDSVPIAPKSSEANGATNVATDLHGEAGIEADLTAMNLQRTDAEHIETNEDDEDESDEEGGFVYPGAQSTATPTTSTAPITVNDDNGDRTIVSHTDVQHNPVSAPVNTSEAKPIDYVRLGSLCSNGSLSELQSFITVTTSPAPAGSGISSFALVNEPNPATGLVPIHYAAREGRMETLKWLIRQAGALVETEDREGETALHKCAMAGKLPALTFLLHAGADANCVDGDGWTPLHNACSKGYLDIVKVLIETAGASIDVKGGRGKWTPLMNAASNGHLPIVRYLTSKHHVDPFVRNAAGETAYDVAAATFEIYICELLERYEAERWAAIKFAVPTQSSSVDGEASATTDRGPYNPLALHSTVAAVIHENQRLDTRLSTLAVRGGTPRWSGTQAGRPDKPDRRAPSTIPPGPLSLSRTRHLPMAREDVKLPNRSQPYKLRLPNRSAQIAAARRAQGRTAAGEEELGVTPTPESVLQRHGSGSGSSMQGQITTVGDAEGAEPSHFWLSTWQHDLTHPQVDADEGWQYSPSFDTPEERWLASVPAPLARLLEGRGLGTSVQRAVSNAVLPIAGANNVAEAEAVNTGWVRRRRWVRVMRRRLDIPFNDELEAVEQASINIKPLATDGTVSTSEVTIASHIAQQAQREAQQAVERLGKTADYLARSRAMAGLSSDSTASDTEEQAWEPRIVRLEMAISELRQHAFSDVDADRQQQAEDLLKDLTAQLGHLRQAAGLDEESDEEDEDEESDGEGFIYPNSYRDGAQSVITRIGGPTTATTTAGLIPNRPPVPLRQSSTPSVFGERTVSGEAGSNSLGAIRSADLAAAREFRVPTNEVPQRPQGLARATSALREHNAMPTWEHDSDVTHCRGCNRRFTFFLRKHHCRRCGRIFCDACSTHRAQLSMDELIIDPGVPEMLTLEADGPTRICDGCDAERRLPRALRNGGGHSLSDALERMEDHTSNGGIRRASDAVSDVSSRASELTECPVCGKSLATLGGNDASEATTTSLQEQHVRQCLENGGGGSVQGGRYLVYRLGDGPIVGKECQICLEDLLVGMTIARLPCLCYYHRHCIDSWFSRGRNCPVHAREW